MQALLSFSSSLVILIVINGLFLRIQASNKTQTDRGGIHTASLVEAFERVNARASFVSSTQLDNLDLSDWQNVNFRDLVLNATLSAISNNYTLINGNCTYKLQYWLKSLVNKEAWSIRVIDAFGKPPASGILQGHFVFPGEFGECINISQPISNTSGDSWNGKYCYLNQPLVAQALAPINLMLGVCIPQECHSNEIIQLLNEGIDLLKFAKVLPVNMSALGESSVICQEPKSLDSLAYIALIVFGTLIALVVIGTLFDIGVILNKKYNNSLVISSDRIILVDVKLDETSQENKPEKKPSKSESTAYRFLISFSAYTNTVKLLTIKRTNEQLDCLHGIRFLSLAWVILGHTFLFSVPVIDNIVTFVSWWKKLPMMIVMNGFLSVDNFFLLSGLLTAYVFLKEVRKSKQVTPGFMFQYYIHRLWRITPPYMLIMFFSISLTRYLSTGPFYPKDGFEIDYCRTTWWTNLFYVNNLNLVKTQMPCLAVSWYLANDMQFHWFAPLLLVPLALYHFKYGVSIAVSLLVVNVITIVIVTATNPGIELGLFGPDPMGFFSDLYVAPWCRFGPFVVGIMLGYVIHLHKTNQVVFSFSKKINVLLWLISLTLMGLILFGIYPNFEGSHPLSTPANILYQATSRTVWAFGLAWVIYACVTSQGGLVNSFFSWSVWIPLSRLTFSAYLFHTTIIYGYYDSLEHSIHAQYSTMIYIYLGHITIAYAGAYLVALVCEVPILGLEKFIFKRH